MTCSLSSCFSSCSSVLAMITPNSLSLSTNCCGVPWGCQDFLPWFSVWSQSILLSRSCSVALNTRLSNSCIASGLHGNRCKCIFQLWGWVEGCLWWALFWPSTFHFNHFAVKTLNYLYQLTLHNITYGWHSQYYQTLKNIWTKVPDPNHHHLPPIYVHLYFAHFTTIFNINLSLYSHIPLLLSTPREQNCWNNLQIFKSVPQKMYCKEILYK